MATILYIDPDETAKKFIQSAVGKKHHIITAGDGPTAIQHCAIIQPDLILMEASLPDIDGYQLAARLKMLMSHTPILVITDNYFDKSENQGWVVYADAFLNKPVEAKELRRQVQLHLPPPAKTPHLSSSLSPDDKIVQQLEAQIAVLNQANQHLASINSISALIGISLDLEHLTDEILGQIEKTIDFDSATLFLLKGDVLEAAASRGFLEHQRGMNIFPRNMRNSAWQVVDNKLPLIINDVSKNEVWETRPELNEIKSWLGVPLIYKDRVVGVLTLDKNETDAFTDANARFVFNLAYQIAIAVENAQLFEEWEKQSTRLKLINEVAQELNTILDEDDLLETLAQTIFERLKYDRVAIFEVNSTRSHIQLKVLYGDNYPQLEPGVYQQDINVGLLGEAARTGRALLINDTLQNDSFLTLEGIDVRSELVIPIFIGSQVEAVINVDRNYPNGFSDQDLWTLSSLASQAATTIQNARLYWQVQTYSDRLERTVVARTQRLQAIKKISQVVSQGLDVDELLAVVGQGISQIFTADTDHQVQVAIGLLDGPDLLLKTIYQDNGHVDGQRVLRLNIDAQASIKQVVDDAGPVSLENFDPSGTASTLQNSVMMAPLITGGKTIGLIKVESSNHNNFDESDLETLETLAFQVASAIDHARLLKRTREIAIVEERTRLARDMHDGVAQNLAYLLLQVDGCLNMVEEGGKLEARLERVHGLLKQNIDELRRNIFDLRPVELEGKSLFEVLENFVSEFGRRWYLETTFTIEGELGEVSSDVESTLYRILQEALSNAQQHAQCKKLSVRLAIENEDWVTLAVQDDGIGFDTAQDDPDTSQTRGLGLVSMRERVNSVGGFLKVESTPGEGTKISARLPLTKALEVKV